MIELYAANQAAKTDGKTEMIVKAVAMIIYLVFFVWAIFRALRCSAPTPDSRALHLMFATLSPVLYLIFSYAVEGFCKK